MASLDDRGDVTEKIKFPTDQDYQAFLQDLKQNLGKLKTGDFSYCGAGVPSSNIDRERWICVSFGNLPWENVAMKEDIGNICGCPVALENDAKVAGLSEATLLGSKYRRVLYMTVSTGIGFALIEDGRIDTDFGDGGGRTLLLEHDGRSMPWEDFASGRAMVKRYGQRAEDIEDEDTWLQISRDLAQGLEVIIGRTKPQAIVIGGGVGVHFDKYGSLLQAELERRMAGAPAVIQARHPEEAVIYGCYDLIKQAAG